MYTFQSYIRDPDILRKAIAESDVKEEGGGVLVNLNVTTGANEKLEELKKFSIKKQVEISESTYEDKQSEHVYISDGFENAGISVEAEVLDKYYMQLTDHKMIAITLKAS